MFSDIRNMQKFAENNSDWSILNHKIQTRLNTKWRAGDEDGVLNVKGHRLTLEEKDEYANIGKGQEIKMIDEKNAGYTTTLVLYGRNEYEYTHDNEPIFDENGLHIFKRKIVNIVIIAPDKSEKEISTRHLSIDKAWDKVTDIIVDWYYNIKDNPINSPELMIKHQFNRLSTENKIAMLNALKDMI